MQYCYIDFSTHNETSRHKKRKDKKDIFFEEEALSQPASLFFLFGFLGFIPVSFRLTGQVRLILGRTKRNRRRLAGLSHRARRGGTNGSPPAVKQAGALHDWC